jgi:hypothetical protein
MGCGDHEHKDGIYTIDAEDQQSLR